MKKLLFSLAMLFVATISFAQTSQVATLRHNGNLIPFYGADALIQAYEEASDEDVITLSSGIFNAVNIAKAVTIRGAGMDTDEATNRERTTIVNDFTISPTTGITSEALNMEGLYINGTMKYAANMKNATFIRCRFGTITYNGSGSSFTFIQCNIQTSITLTSNCSANIINYPLVELD